MIKWSALIALALEVAAPAEVPRSAPPEFATRIYGLTFAVPNDATYCPLPADWVGSDHGTTVFLQKPRSCGGAGYPSSSRSFEPHTVARIKLFYGYVTWDEVDEPPRPKCRHVGKVRFLGEDRTICERRERGLVIREVRARYMAETEAEAILTLVTLPHRLERDAVTFRAAAASMRACNRERDTVHCPSSAKYF